MKQRRTPRPAWVDTAKAGDVLLWPSGDMRVIRKVTVHTYRGRSEPRVRSPIFDFAIRRCSWTERPYTVYQWAELVRMGVTALGVSVALDTKMDKQLLRDINTNDRSRLTCCRVAGVMP